jgi:SnoaL-like domain
MRQTIQQIEAFAERWYAAWNAHDLDRILSHYHGNVIFRSPLVPVITGRDDATVLGRHDLAHYFGCALETFPDLRLEPLALMFGAGTVVLQYRSGGRLLVAEAMGLDADLRVMVATAYYDRLPQDDSHSDRAEQASVLTGTGAEIAAAHHV